MTDRSLVDKRLTLVEACIRDLGLIDAANIESNLVHERFAEHTLQIAIQAVIDVAAHIVADERLGTADTNQILVDLLARHGWLPLEQLPALHAMIGFRNVLVHQYIDVDLRIVRDIVEHHTGDLQRFVDAIRARLA